PQTYSGSNPHTDHVHVSGKHGSTGYSSNTGTGYDVNAENYRPEGLDAMPDVRDIWMWDIDASGEGGMSSSHGLWLSANRTGYLANEWAPATTKRLTSIPGD